MRPLGAKLFLTFGSALCWSSGMFWDGFQWVPRADTGWAKHEPPGNIRVHVGGCAAISEFVLRYCEGLRLRLRVKFVHLAVRDCCRSFCETSYARLRAGIANDVNASRKNRRLYLGSGLMRKVAFNNQRMLQNFHVN